MVIFSYSRGEIAPANWCLFRKAGDSEQTIADEDTKQQQRQEKSLLCIQCGHTITSESYRISLNGSHRHYKTNPHGAGFHIGCFDSAAGCRGVHAEFYEHSWFAGYTWQVAVCANCSHHLGWRFRSEKNSFYGLILDQLRSE
jgi:hypothetical protein